MSDSNLLKSAKKSGRTPEQQAARDARKAAKASRVVVDPISVGESSSVANVGYSSPPHKRRRSSASVAPDEGDRNLLEINTEAPAPLSKAEARAVRKKAKRGEDVEPKVTKEPAEPKRKNSIWIGNLSYRITPTNLRDFLQRGVAELGGEVDSVTRVNLPTKVGKGSFAENKGFAYVDFASPESQALALQLSEKPFEGRRVLIKLGDDHNPTPTARTPKPPTVIAGTLPRKNKHGESSTLFVGNLPFDATEEALRDLVEMNAIGLAEAIPEATDGAEPSSRSGKKSGLKKVRLGAFEDTGRCKGFAFLDFHSPLLAKVALANRKNHFYNGRKLNVEYASEEATKRAGGRSSHKTGDLSSKNSRPIREEKEWNDGAENLDQDEDAANVRSRRVAQTSKNDKISKNDTRGKKWESSGRPRPGAALAMAKREKIGIVEGEGQKIVFD